MAPYGSIHPLQEGGLTATLTGAIEQGEALGRALRTLEVVLARRDAAPRELSTALSQVRTELRAHVRRVEAVDHGLLSEIVTRAPRLAHAVDQLRTDHKELNVLATEALAAACRLHDPPHPEMLAFARADAAALAAGLRAHRAEGAQVVYDAYDVDLRGGD